MWRLGNFYIHAWEETESSLCICLNTSGTGSNERRSDGEAGTCGDCRDWETFHEREATPRAADRSA